MKHVKLFEQFQLTPLYEEVNSIMGGKLTEAEIQDLLNEGFFSWLKGLFSNPKKKRELDRLADKLVDTRVAIAKIDIEENNIESYEEELDAKTDPYTNTKVSAKVGGFDKNDPTQIKRASLEQLETDILQQMDSLGEESPTLQKYVNKIKLDSRMKSTEEVMRLADAEVKKVFMKLHKKDKKASAQLNKELQKELK